MRAVQVVVIVKVALVILALDPLAADSFALPKSLVSHAAAVALVPLLVLVVLRGGPSVIPRSPLHWGVLAVFGTFVLATPFAVDSTVALFGSWRRYLGLTQMLDNVALYFAVAIAFRSARDAGLLLKWIIVASGLSAIYGIVQVLGADPITYREASTTRPIATFGQPDVAGAFFSIAAATAIASLLVMRRVLLSPSALLGLAFISVSLLLVGAAAARDAILALAASWITMLVILLVGGRRKAATQAVALGLIGLIALAASPVGSRLDVGHLLDDHSVAQRIEIWRAALVATAEHPLLGVGPDNFVAVYPAVHTEQSAALNVPESTANSTHNWLLYASTSTGIAGVLALLALIGLLMHCALRAVRGRRVASSVGLVAVVAYLAQGLVNVNDLSLDWIFWVGLGVVAGRCDDHAAELAPDRSARSALATACGLLVFGAALLVSWPRLSASHALADSQQLLQPATAPLAIERARQAIGLDGRRAEYWSSFGTALSAAGSPQAAVIAYRDAADRQPWQPLYWLDIGLMRLASGDEPAAIRAFNEALARDRYDAKSLDLLARLSYNHNDLASAVTYSDRLVRVQPSDASSYDVAIRANLDLHEWARAEQLITAARKLTDSITLRIQWARALVGLGRNDEAKVVLDGVLALEPANVEAIDLRRNLP